MLYFCGMLTVEIVITVLNLNLNTDKLSIPSLMLKAVETKISNIKRRKSSLVSFISKEIRSTKTSSKVMDLPLYHILLSQRWIWRERLDLKHFSKPKTNGLLDHLKSMMPRNKLILSTTHLELMSKSHLLSFQLWLRIWLDLPWLLYSISLLNIFMRHFLNNGFGLRLQLLCLLYAQVGLYTLWSTTLLSSNLKEMNMDQLWLQNTSWEDREDNGGEKDG